MNEYNIKLDDSANRKLTELMEKCGVNDPSDFLTKLASSAIHEGHEVMMRVCEE